MVEYSLDLQNINLSAIRTVRVLRPLKAINRVPSKSVCLLLFLTVMGKRTNSPASLLWSPERGWGGANPTYFTFDSHRYEQIKGAPMGSPISGVIEEAVLQKLEYEAMKVYEPRCQWNNYVLPYIQGVSETAARILLEHRVKVAHKLDQTLKMRVMRPKETLPKEETSSVVYRINCSDCASNYIGETTKRLQTRVHEHELATPGKTLQEEQRPLPIGEQGQMAPPPPSLSMWIYPMKAQPGLSKYRGAWQSCFKL
ncbi:Voltage-dependent T-type calcium channel subunit alpha-1I, partial [Ophiophagus hannah]